MKKRGENIFLRVKLGVLLLFFPLLYLIPQESVFHGHTVCLFKNLFDVECIGCGMTRAVFSLLYFRFDEAWGYNKLVFIVAPILFYLYVKQVLLCWRQLFHKSSC